MLGKKKKQQIQDEPNKLVKTSGYGPVARGMPVAAFFVPALVLAVALIAGLLTAAFFQGRQNANEQLERVTEVAARGLAQYLATAVQKPVDTLELLLQVLSVHRSFTDDASREAMAQTIQNRLPGALEVRLLPVKGWDEDRVQAYLFGKFAAMEMYQKVVSSKAAVPVEALKDEQGKLFFVALLPVQRDGVLKGVAAARFTLDQVLSGIEPVAMQSEFIVVEQQGGMRLLSLGASRDKQAATGSLPVKGTIWKVEYGVIVPPVSPYLNAYVLGAGGALLLMLAILWALRAVKHGVETDALVVEALVEALQAQKGSPTRTASLRENSVAIQRLLSMAQSGVMTVKEQVKSENRAGQVQIVASDVETEPTSRTLVVEPEQLPPSIFHAGFMRWPVSRQPESEVLQALGLALGSLCRQGTGRTALLARDNSEPSDKIAAELAAGLLGSGCEVIDLGVSPLPVLAQAAYGRSDCIGVMVTGGHLSPEYAGFKILMEDRYLSATRMAEWRKFILDGDFAQGQGNLVTADYREDYLVTVMEDIQLVESYKVVVDCGNETTGAFLQRILASLDCEVILMSGGFDNASTHGSDPGSAERLAALSKEVLVYQADLGVALDLDGAAFTVVDEKGQVVPADLILMLLAGDIIKRNPGADVLYDNACTASLAGHVLSEGGRPIMWKSGAESMQSKLFEVDGLLAGEFSGRLYIRERWNGFDDAFYAVLRLLEYLSLEGLSLSEASSHLSSLVATPRLVVPTDEGEAEALVLALREKSVFSEADINEVDGLRVEFEDAWGMVRASRSQAALILRFEGNDEQALDRVKDRFRQALLALDENLSLPF